MYRRNYKTSYIIDIEQKIVKSSLLISALLISVLNQPKGIQI